MGIGASIFMICLGAIITFGLRGPIPWLDWLDLKVVGMVMMLGGIIGLITTLIFWGMNRRQGRVTPPPVDRTQHAERQQGGPYYY